MGSLFYVAPEVLDNRYTKKCDLWSVGAMLYVILSGKVPFPGDKPINVMSAIKKGDFHFDHPAFKQVSDSAKDLITRLLQKDIDKRLSAE